MVVTASAKPCLSLYVTLGRFHTEGIGFRQFVTLYDSFDKACNRSFLHRTKYEHGVDFIYGDKIIGTFSTDGSMPQFCRKITRSRLLFENEYHATVQFTLVEKTPLHVETITGFGKPCSVQLYQKWIFTHKNKTKYEFIKLVSGRTKELACQESPSFFIHVSVQEPISRDAAAYTELLLRKTFDIFGYGPDPNLRHCPLRHNGRATQRHKKRKLES